MEAGVQVLLHGLQDSPMRGWGNLWLGSIHTSLLHFLGTPLHSLPCLVDFKQGGSLVISPGTGRSSSSTRELRDLRSVWTCWMQMLDRGAGGITVYTENSQQTPHTTANSRAESLMQVSIFTF